MEIVKSRYGSDRSIERIDFGRILVMGESSFNRRLKKKGEIASFDFEGGPIYTVGSKIAFENSFWKITGIKENQSRNELTSITLSVSPVYN